MKIFLLSDSANVLQHNDDIEVLPLGNTLDYSLNGLLETLTKKSCDVVVIYAELLLKDGSRSSTQGLELLKHIRLTPELSNINKLPIVFVHWQSIDAYISKDQENIILYSPGIMRIKLPAKNIDWKQLSPVNENLSPFLFGSEKDEEISDHTFRNRIAIEQFKKQVNNPVIELINKELWYKKNFYKNFNGKIWNTAETIEPYNKKLKVLFADDMADDWVKPLKKAAPNCDFIIGKTLNEIELMFPNKVGLDIEKVNRINTLSLVDKKAEIIAYFNDIFHNDFNIILLDLYFSNAGNKIIEESDGYKILNLLQKNVIFTPVVIFSATIKNISHLRESFNNITGHFIKSYFSVNDLTHILRSAGLNDMLNKISHKAACLKEYGGKYFDISKREMQKELRFQITMNLISIIDKIKLIEFYFQKNDIDETVINKILEEIMGLICIIQEASTSKDDYTQFQWYIQNIRDSVFHSGVVKGDYNTWKTTKLENKIRKIDDAMKSVYSAILFRVQL